MPLNSKSLARMAGIPVGSNAATPTSNLNQIYKFLYATDDTAAVVEAAGYFNNARALLTPGSIIDVAVNVAAGPVQKTYIVTAVPAAPGNVTIALQTVAAG